MTIPILIEPTAISFELAHYRANFTSEENERTTFKKFIILLKNLFNTLSSNNLAIACTQDMLYIYINSIPCSVYKNSFEYNLARELIPMRLCELAMKVHSLGDHSYNVIINSTYIKDPNLFNEEIYHHWIDLSGLTLINKLPKVALTSPNSSAFNNDIIISEEGGLHTNLQLVDDVDSLIDCSEIKRLRVAESLLNFQGKPYIDVICTGTSTHSSMWDLTIRTINDIPPFERELFKTLVNTTYVKSITFLSFDKRYPAVGSPALLVEDVSEGQDSLILVCTLRGKGKKQHSQSVRIEFTHDAKSLIAYCGKEITVEKILGLLNEPLVAVAFASGRSGSFPT